MNSLIGNYRMQRYIQRFSLHWNETMPVLFDLALDLAKDKSSVINAPNKIVYNGNVYVALKYIM